MGCRTETEVMNTIRPWSERFRSGSAALTSRTALMRVSSNAGSQLSSGVLSNVPGGGPPAFTTRMSRPPSLPRAWSTRASGSLETSPAAQPTALIALPVASIAAASRDEMKTPAPSTTSASAHARPRPLLAAVTRARRPFSPRSTCAIVSDQQVRSLSPLARSAPSRGFVKCQLAPSLNSGTGPYSPGDCGTGHDGGSGLPPCGPHLFHPLVLTYHPVTY